ncbi:upstream stimulatory factor 2 isoform 4-T4 [Callospermophilus lateralis]|uniref:upstream stimulatory factor 2 isoform X4 n=1 Tax=Callospermophilus lateralis TaxID=76772 RepID=UPI004038E62E
MRCRAAWGRAPGRRGAGTPDPDPSSSCPCRSHDKGPEAEEGVELQEGGDGPGAEEQTAVAIASVQQAAFGDHNIQYQFRTENNGGQVTYRVVQVTDGQLDGQGDTAGAVSVVSTAAFAGGQQAVTQVGVDGAAQRPGPAAASVPPGPAAPFPLAVIQNPFSNGGSPAAEAVSGEARFAYFPASSVGDTTAVSVQTTDQSLQAGEKLTEPEHHGMREEELSTTKWSGGGGTRSTTGSSNFQKSFQTVMQTIARQERVKGGSCRRPAITSGSYARPTSACRRPSRRPSGCRWTMSSCGNRSRS